MCFNTIVPVVGFEIGNMDKENTFIKDNEDAALERYAKLVTVIARKYYLEGGEYEDLIQEGMIGLIHAIRTFDESKSDNFEYYAAVCIRNKIYDTIRKANKGGGKIDFVLTDFESHTEYSALDSHNPETQILAQESAEEIEKALANTLSRFESSVAELYLCGLSSSEIAERLSKSKKSVSNAIVRIRKKAEKCLMNGRIQG